MIFPFPVHQFCQALKNNQVKNIAFVPITLVHLYGGGGGHMHVLVYKGHKDYNNLFLQRSIGAFWKA